MACWHVLRYNDKEHKNEFWAGQIKIKCHSSFSLIQSLQEHCLTYTQRTLHELKSNRNLSVRSMRYSLEYGLLQFCQLAYLLCVSSV